MQTMDEQNSKFHEADVELRELIDDLNKVVGRVQVAIAKVTRKPTDDDATAGPAETSAAA
ncbi:hypothetical protein [Rhodoplanes azumiensis]|uniref:Uncharacterized protein n=1 Tax=Rhodoplanes azumiensis TaxID=1897628 RepID=A0ABW5ALB4_9BRAD